ncbi:MAG: hypothetical protein AVDCRST_MAG75-571 [uncultured Propionibacteriaceae bacterium]|uniref:Uncharacterized protein n=1 Tax=uncultured Propionibacteriaceae bacterium TaxID=257457 RepID=A0A6J4N3I2_9ACTN|nr:MAG: hypothetical protein AVDCRST_MAG75-571 [uncultured Propionibacteriaceae bacterium]
MINSQPASTDQPINLRVPGVGRLVQEPDAHRRAAMCGAACRPLAE